MTLGVFSHIICTTFSSLFLLERENIDLRTLHECNGTGLDFKIGHLRMTLSDLGMTLKF